MKTKTLPVALVQERNHGDAAANLAVIEQRVAEAATAVLAQAYPGREIVQVPCRPLIWQNGSLHCITMQLPEGLV